MSSQKFLLEDFELFFSQFIRVLLNWERLKETKANVRVTIYNGLEPFSNWYLPWYLSSMRKEISYRDAVSKPLTLHQVVDDLSILDEARRCRIQGLSDSFMECRASQCPQVMIASYALPGNKHLILDGNHRASALALSGVKAKVMTFEVFGLIKQEILPDLKFWEKVM